MEICTPDLKTGLTMARLNRIARFLLQLQTFSELWLRVTPMLAYGTAHRRFVTIVQRHESVYVKKEGFRNSEGAVVALQQGADDTCLISLGSGLDWT